MVNLIRKQDVERPKNLIGNRSFWLHSIIWIVYLAGAIWLKLGWFTFFMEHTAGYLVISASIIAFILFYKNENNRKKLLVWYILFLLLGYGVEWLGVHRGIIFGNYSYGSALGIGIDGVPLAIAFAWPMVSLMSINLFSGFKLPLIVFVFLVAFVSTMFDFLMEPAAVFLNYWTWEENIPVSNYLAWFILSGGMAFVGKTIGLFKVKSEGLVHSLFFAQIVFFILVLVYVR